MAEQTFNTHCFDTTTLFSSNKNYILHDSENNFVDRSVNQPSLKTKIAFYPMRLKEGTGITYRINYGSNIWTSLRVGYGWQQDYNQFSYLYSHSADATYDDVTLNYDYYTEEADRSSKGIERHSYSFGDKPVSISKYKFHSGCVVSYGCR